MKSFLCVPTIYLCFEREKKTTGKLNAPVNPRFNICKLDAKGYKFQSSVIMLLHVMVDTILEE